MTTLSSGDLIRDNLGRKGIDLERSSGPDTKWLREQDEATLRHLFAQVRLRRPKRSVR